MESVLKTAGMVLAECHQQQRQANVPVLQSLLFYIQGWHYIFHNKFCFDAQLYTKNGVGQIFPFIADHFGDNRNNPIAATEERPGSLPGDPWLIAAVVASYAKASDSALLVQTSSDIDGVRHHLHNSQLPCTEAAALQKHFGWLVKPEQLRGHPFHGLFMDQYRARKYNLVHWSPPGGLTPEELDEFDALVVE